uniref:Putative serine/threonine-protein kinase kinX-like n=1 Tax=Solanum chacoense TaxID=4108 RepID=A0A0V0IE79_SOLCH
MNLLKLKRRDDGVVQDEAPIEDTREDKETDSYASLTYEPPTVEEKDDAAVQNEAPVDDSSKEKETDAYVSLTYDPPKEDSAVQAEAPIEDSVVQAEAPIEDSALEFESQLSKFFDTLNIKYDPKDSSSIILFGGAVLTALWLTTSIVGAIDSVPLFPK